MTPKKPPIPHFCSAVEAFEAVNDLASKCIPCLFAFDYELSEAFFIPYPLEQRDILFEMPTVSNASGRDTTSSAIPNLQANPISFETYRQRFDCIQRGLRRGDSFLANLTIATPITSALTLSDIFSATRAKYKLFVPNRFVCFSPEPFVEIDLQERRIETRPMKGTIDASIPNAEQKILEDPKEKAEHYTIVDLMRSDLARVATDIRVEKFRYVEEVSARERTLLQVSSCISGKIPEKSILKIGDIFRQLLPAGSICGAPKGATRKLIAEAEPSPRGFYSGVFGYFDGSHVDSAVMIRFIAQMADGLRYHSGGGITINSQPESEYREILQKIYLPR